MFVPIVDLGYWCKRWRREIIKKARIDNNNKIIAKLTGSGATFKKAFKTLEAINDRNVTYSRASNEWVLPYRDEYVQILRDLNFDISSELYMKFTSGKEDLSWKQLEIEETYNYLFDYQKDLLRFSEYFDNRILISLEMGGGKTVSSLAIMDRIDQFPVLIVVPATIKEGWRREYLKFINKDDRIAIVESSKDLINYNDSADIVIVNYELLARNMDRIQEGDDTVLVPKRSLKLFKRSGFRVGILDEIHRIKNPNSKTSNAVHFLMDRTDNVLALTGTPILSSSKDLYMILNLLYPETFNSYYRFCNRYCNVKYYKGQRDFYGARNSAELNDVLKNIGMFRLTKEEMGKVSDAPLVSVIPLKMKNDTKYREIEKDLADAEGFSIIDKLKKEAWEQKKESFYNTLDDMLEESDDKFVVFLHNRNVMDDLMKKYERIALKIDGSVSTKSGVRQGIIDKFNSSKKHRIIFGSIGAMSTGVDGLQHCSSTVLFAQWSWVFAEIDQAISRIHRTGQTKQVNVYHFPAQDTIEEVFMNVLDKKAKISKEIVDNTSLSEKEMLSEILRITKEGVLG